MFALIARPRERGRRRMRAASFTTILLISIVGFTPVSAFACACGCGVFDVGTSSMLPSGVGGTVFLGFDFQSQTKNWSGGGQASGANNPDKVLRTQFWTLGFQYMLNRSWGFQIELPYWNRYFATDTNFGGSPPDVKSNRWWGVGDVRIRGIYTGFSDDLSTGVTYGLKLPTGNNRYDPTFVDSDTQIGSGSTDILLGAFHRRNLTADGLWTGFVQAQLDVPVLIQNQYRPGTELDLATGVYYTGWFVGNFQISPLAQAIVSIRGRDSGDNAANPVASGYERLLLSPGIQISFGQFSFYADVELPVLQNFNGNQLTAPYLIKSFVMYSF